MFRERNVINTYLDAYEIFMLNLLISAFPSPTHITDFPNRKAHYGAIVPPLGVDDSEVKCDVQIKYRKYVLYIKYLKWYNFHNRQVKVSKTILFSENRIHMRLE